MGYWGLMILVVGLIGVVVALDRLIRQADRNDDATHGTGSSAATW
jgi:hypothetical protein